MQEHKIQGYLDKCRKVPITRATVPGDGLHWIYKDRWWLVVDECILFYSCGKNGTGSPQCNPTQALTERIRDRLCPEAEVRHLDAVFREED